MIPSSTGEGATPDLSRERSAPPAGRWLAMIAVASLAAIAYANTLGNDFVWDDVHLIERNPHLSLDRIPDLLTEDFGRMAVPGDPNGLYRPVVLMSFLLDRELHGLDPTGYHVTNLLLHGLVSILVLVLASRWIGTWLPAVVVASIFAVHPIHTESVTWISGRSDVLAALFFVATLLLYQRGREGSTPAYVGALVTAALAMGSKEVSITLPAVLVAIELVHRIGGRGVAASLRSVLPFAIFAGLLAVRLVSIRVPWEPIFPEDAGIAERAWTAASTIFVYAGRMLAPVTLNAELEPPVVTTPGLASFAGLAIVLILGVVALAGWRRRPGLTLAIFLAAVTLFPTLSLLADVSELGAERYLYLPSVGLLVAAGFAIPTAARARTAVLAATLLLVALGLARTVDRNRDWRTGEEFHTVTAATAPGNKRARFKLAYVLHEEGKVWKERRNFPLAEQYLERAEAEYRASVAIDSDYLDGRQGLGVALLELGRVDEAIDVLTETLRRYPSGPDVARNLSRAFLKAGRLDEAFPLLAAEEELDPEAAGLAADLYLEKGRPGDAARILGRALERHPDSAELYQALGVAYARAGAFVPASDCFRRAIALDPTDGDSMANLAMALLRFADPAARRPDEAIAYAEQAVKLDPHPRHYLILADVYFHSGYLPNARGVLEQGLALGPSDEAPFRQRLARLDEIAASTGAGRPGPRSDSDQR